MNSDDAKIHLYELRAEDFARNFQSHREMEWHTTYQTYGGYAALAVAFHEVQPVLG